MIHLLTLISRLRGFIKNVSGYVVHACICPGPALAMMKLLGNMFQVWVLHVDPMITKCCGLVLQPIYNPGCQSIYSLSSMIISMHGTLTGLRARIFLNDNLTCLVIFFLCPTLYVHVCTYILYYFGHDHESSQSCRYIIFYTVEHTCGIKIIFNVSLIFCVIPGSSKSVREYFAA